MASLYAFCSLDELTEWVRRWRFARSLCALAFDTDDRAVLLPPSQPLALESNSNGVVSAVYLFPEVLAPVALPSRRDVRPRDAGWIEIRPDGIGMMNDEGPYLFLSEIHGEPTSIWKAEREIQWLRAQLKADLTFGTFVGLRGASESARVERRYAYSKGAMRLYESGVEWRQRGTRNIAFSPAGGG